MTCLETKVVLNGKLKEGVTGKDVIITLCGFFNKDEVLNHAIEFSGDGVKYLSIDGLQPIYVQEFDAYFYANRIEQWKFNGSTRVELIQIPI